MGKKVLENDSVSAEDAAGLQGGGGGDAEVRLMVRVGEREASVGLMRLAAGSLVGLPERLARAVEKAGLGEVVGVEG